MIVVWGYGSIGKRHAENLRSLDKKVAVVSRKAKELRSEISDLAFVEELGDLPLADIEGLIIATPTALHIEHLKAALHLGLKKIYLEKPVSHTKAGVDEVDHLIEQTGAAVYVGYDLRLDHGIREVKNLLDTGSIGKVCSFHAQVGQYLPDWRPHEDYRQGMSAKAALGGGVMLDLIHELDYLYYLFGEVTALFNSHGQRSELEIDTEDCSDSLLLFKDGFSGTLHLDYLQKVLCRNLHIIGSQGVIHLDLAERKLQWNSIKKPEWEIQDYSTMERNDRFKAAMKAFINDDSDVLCSWKQALVSLQWVLLSKKSGLAEQVEKLEN